MSVGTFAWFCVLPVARQNLVSNPSAEIGTAGWAGTGAATVLGTNSAAQAFGAWSFTATGATDGAGGSIAVTGGAGTPYTASAYVQITGVSGGSVQISLGGTTNRVPVGSAWQRVAVGTVGNPGAVAVQRYGNVGAAGTLWLDGVQVEAGSITTYLDGDQEGCQWLGAPHVSQSFRSGQSRAGGTVVSLAALGMRPETHAGVGMPPVVNLAQDRAQLDGAEFQRQRAGARNFALTATITGTSVAGLHQTRRRIIDALNIDRTTPQQPTRFLYTGADGTVAIDAVYSGGLEIDDMRVIDDRVNVSFTAHNPRWYGVTDQGTSLAPYTSLGSVNYLAYRDPLGQWGTLGASVGGYGPDTNNVQALVCANGTLFAAGCFRTAGGTAAHMVAMHAGGNWGTMAGGALGTGPGTSNAYVAALFYNDSGTLFAGGNFDPIAGTSSKNMAQWSGAWGTLTGGTLTAAALSIARDPRTSALYVGGGNFTAGGTAAARYLAKYEAGAWGTLAGGTPASNVRDLAFMPSGGTLWAVGDFTSVAGTTARRAAFWNRTRWGTPAGEYAGDSLYALALGQNAQIYAAGGNNTGEGQPRRYRPGAVGTLPGLDFSDAAGACGALLVEPGGALWAAGNYFTLYGGIFPLPFGLAQWNGYSWLPADMIMAGGQQLVQALSRSSDGTLYAGGLFYGVGTAASVTPVVNTSMGNAFPALRMRNTGAGTARVYQLLNTSTGDNVWFDLVLAAGEMVTFDTTPGGVSLTSLTRGNLFNTILPGGNPAVWHLQPGTNWVSFLADSAQIRADLFYRPRHASIDGGASPSAPSAL